MDTYSSHRSINNTHPRDVERTWAACKILPPDGHYLPIASGVITLIDPGRYAEFSQFKWRLDRSCKNLYAVSGHGSQRKLHRLVIGAKPGEIVDHIDGDGLNNRRANLSPIQLEVALATIRNLEGK